MKIFFVFMTLLLAGCVHYHPRPIAPMESADRFDSRRLNDAGLQNFAEKALNQKFPEWPPKVWNEELLTAAAFYFQPSLEVARAQWLEASAGIKTANERPNPTLNVTPGYDTSVPAGMTPWFPLEFLDVPLETAGKRKIRVAQATNLSLSGRSAVITAAWQVREQVRASLLESVAAQKRSELLKQQANAQEQAYKLLEQRADAGEISRNELITPRLSADRARVDLDDAHLRETDARAKLALAIGIPIVALNQATLAFDFSRQGDANILSADIRRIALTHRSDILSALADYQAAEQGYHLEIAKQYPDVHLDPGYQFDLGDNKWSLGLIVELPILNHNEGPVAETAARRKTAAAKFEELQAQVINQIDGATTDYQIALEQLETGRNLSNTARKQENTIQAQVKAGAAERTELFMAQADVAGAELVKLDEELKLQQALGALETALQTSLDANLNFSLVLKESERVRNLSANKRTP